MEKSHDVPVLNHNGLVLAEVNALNNPNVTALVLPYQARHTNYEDDSHDGHTEGFLEFIPYINSGRCSGRTILESAETKSAIVVVGVGQRRRGFIGERILKLKL